MNLRERIDTLRREAGCRPYVRACADDEPSWSEPADDEESWIDAAAEYLEEIDT